jgi:hypothetical protein
LCSNNKKNGFGCGFKADKVRVFRWNKAIRAILKDVDKGEDAEIRGNAKNKETE